MVNLRKLSLVLTILGCFGVGSTAAIAVKCSKKADQTDDKKEKAKAYIPAVVSGVVTMGCIAGSHCVSRKEILALTATCGYFAAKNARIEEEVEKKISPEELEEMKKRIAKEKLERDIEIEESGYGKVHFVEYFLGREFWCSLERVEWAEQELNKRFHNGEYVCMNDFYKLLGIHGSQAGYWFGWPATKDFCDLDLETPIPFENILGEDEYGNLMYMIDIRTKPVNYWMEV